VLVEGPSSGEVEAAAIDLARLLRGAPSVARVIDRWTLGAAAGNADPTLAWRYAGPTAQAALARAVTPEGMRARLDATRELLLAPGAAEAEGWLGRDPLRLSAIPWESTPELAAGVTPGPDGAFVGDGGRARLIVLSARGGAFDGAASAAFVREVDAAFAQTRAAHPGVTLGLTGGHAIAQATRSLLIQDLALSGSLSLVLASVTFLVTFRRARALVGVIPPLLVGTVWTSGLAAFVPGGLSAIAIGFAAVVVGVGVDTGVHVYSALLDARRAGLAPAEAARAARAATARPTLLAACTAAIAFGSLALSDLRALRQLGLLCAAGEVLTAIAIVVMTPAIGAWLERKAPPPRRAPRWIDAILWLTRTTRRAWVAIGAVGALVAVAVIVGLPGNADAIVAIRPRALAPLRTQEEIYRVFGGRPGQWIVLVADTDAARARDRNDGIADALDRLAATHDIAGFDSAGTFAPSPETQARRMAARDALDLPARRDTLVSALREKGFDLEACAPALDAFARPTDGRPSPAPNAGAEPSLLAWVHDRHEATDGGETLLATYVRPTGNDVADARAVEAIRAADPGAVVTGYPYLERDLERSLAHDLPRIGAVALLLVAVALRAMLGRTRDVVLALATVAAELACVALVMRALHLRWHVYDALVLPVLVGVTIDESMFLLHAARAAPDTEPVGPALRAQGPLVASTAMTTAAGFAALIPCKFEGLADLGAVGTLGVLAGLAAALVLVPAGLRLGARTSREKQ
jgi:predicted exporter